MNVGSSRAANHCLLNFRQTHDSPNQILSPAHYPQRSLAVVSCHSNQTAPVKKHDTENGWYYQTRNCCADLQGYTEGQWRKLDDRPRPN